MPQQVFLERRSYRKRRMMDGVRLLPFLGLLLWMVPLMWPLPTDGTGAQALPKSTALQYIFLIWVLLIAASWTLGRWTRSATPPTEDAAATPDAAPH